MTVKLKQKQFQQGTHYEVRSNLHTCRSWYPVRCVNARSWASFCVPVSSSPLAFWLDSIGCDWQQYVNQGNYGRSLEDQRNGREFPTHTRPFLTVPLVPPLWPTHQVLPNSLSPESHFFISHRTRLNTLREVCSDWDDPNLLLSYWSSNGSNVRIFL